MSTDDDNDEITLANDLVESIAKAKSNDDTELNFRKRLSDHYPPHQVLQILRVLRW